MEDQDPKKDTPCHFCPHYKPEPEPEQQDDGRVSKWWIVGLVVAGWMSNMYYIDLANSYKEKSTQIENRSR